MSAPNPQSIYDFETQLEDAFADVVSYFLAQQGLSAAVYTATDGEIQACPRIGIVASISAIVPQWAAIRQANPKQVPVARFFELTARVVVTKPDANLGPLRGVVRYAGSAGAKGFNTTNLPYLQILEIYDVTGSGAIENEEKEQQVAEIVFGGQFAIRSDAWPATP